jgi:beta-lactamase class A
MTGLVIASACVPRLLASPQIPAGPPTKSMQSALAELEARYGGRLGVAIARGDDNHLIADHRADERFPMCSTFKFLAVANVLMRVDTRQERLDRFIEFGKNDILEYAPVTSSHVAEGRMSVGDLCAAAIEVSDNTAANLLLATIDGPSGLTRFARGLGDQLTRLDRNEPSANGCVPGDPRDTTTPAAMLVDMRGILLGSTLSARSRDMLETWMQRSTRGLGRIRAGLPAGWRVGDKAGTGSHGTNNDIAIIRTPGGEPILACAYYTESKQPHDVQDEVLATVGRLVAAHG